VLGVGCATPSCTEIILRNSKLSDVLRIMRNLGLEWSKLRSFSLIRYILYAHDTIYRIYIIMLPEHRISAYEGLATS